jgi:coenzyme F420 hydrogenase subunit beta
LLNIIESSPDPCVFVGKPCDAAAVAQARKVRPRLDANLGLVLSFFCAGTPCTKATLDLLHRHNIHEEDISDLRYRAEGWPGLFRVARKQFRDDFSMTYMASWSSVAGQRPFRCHLCPDGLGQLADITSGDAWNRYDSGEENPGLSHVLIRSKRGAQMIEKAIANGYLTLEKISPADVIEAQGLVERRREVFGRLFGMWLLGLPFTRFKGFELLKAWLRNSPYNILRTVLGTQRRLVQRGMCRPKPIGE